MAKQSETRITEETSDRIERIRAALAANQKVSEEDRAWLADFDAKQDVVQAALTDGRLVIREEHVEGDTRFVTWTEYIPAPSGIAGDALIRQGYDKIIKGPIDDITTRTVTYFDANGRPAGTIESFLNGGHERITNILGFGPGGEYSGLNIGDTRPSPVPSTGPAGMKPHSFDPGNGSFGSASGGTRIVPGFVDPLSADIDAFVTQGLSNPVPGPNSGGSGGSSSTQSGSSGSVQTGSTSPSQTDSPSGGGLGSPGMGATDLSGPSTSNTDSGPSDMGGGSDGGDKMGDTVDADPGDTEQGGTDGGDASSGQTNDSPPPTESSPQQDTGASGDSDFTVEGSFEHVENVNTGQVGAEMGSGDVMTTEGMVKPVEGHWADTDDRIASDDYYSAGSAPTPQPGQGGQDQTVSKSGSGGGGSSSEMSWDQWQAHQAATWSDPNWNPEGAPIDYGDTTDPNYDPVVPDPGTPQDDPATQILIDPSFYEESATGPTTRLEMIGSLENTGNPLDENQATAPGGGMPNTSEQELVAGDAMAMGGGEMFGSVAEGPELGSVAADDPDLGGSAAMGDEDGPLP